MLIHLIFPATFEGRSSDPCVKAEVFRAERSQEAFSGIAL